MILRHVLRHLVRPVSRPTALLLLWTHRRTIALWARSVRSEFGRQRTEVFDVQRWKTLVSALWRASKENALVHESEVRRLVVADDSRRVFAPLGADPLNVTDFIRVGIEPVVVYA